MDEEVKQESPAPIEVLKKRKRPPRKKKKPTVAIPPPQELPQPSVQLGIEALDPEAIKTLDLDKLRDSMTQGIYVLESVLFSQASFEFKRISKQRDLISKLETDLFSPEVFDKLSPDQKTGMYHTLQSSMGSSLKFLHNLHENVTSGL